MIWNKKKDGAENPGAETPAAQTTKAPVLFLQKNWKWLVPVVCVVIAGGVFLLKPKSASTTAVDPSYLEASPEVRDVSNTLSGTGTLNPANTYTVKSLVEGKVLTGEFEEGDVLDEGSILYTLDSSDASTNFEKAEIAMQQAQRSYDKVVDRQYVRAEVDGTVSTLKVAKGDEAKFGDYYAKYGYRLLKELYNERNMPTALFVANDSMAAGSYRAAYELGLKIPDDISIIGFNDIPTAKYMVPPLTTVRLYMEFMGEYAVKLLEERIVRGREICVKVSIPTKLYVRDSVKTVK